MGVQLQRNTQTLEKTVFPGIELRLISPMKGRLNAHVLFSDKIEDQSLIDFKGKLEVGLINRPLSDSSLIEYARAVAPDKLRHHGQHNVSIDTDRDAALKAGSMMAEITCESYQEAICSVPSSQAIDLMPFSTSDGLTGIERNEHYAYTLTLFNSSPIFETRDPDLWAAFAGVKTEGNKGWVDSFQSSLNNIPRLAVSGSDAHCFIGTPGDSDKRGYGDYPSNKATWIKADPTFSGLQQVIIEPAKRSFIGGRPPKLKMVEENKGLFLDNLSVTKLQNPLVSGEWLNNVSVDLNPDLVAIIGNKGSGKSALADIVALLGNSKQKHHFSFLKKERFRGRTGEPAKGFDAAISWKDESGQRLNLNSDPSDESVELVKYIPQGHFEDLCNAHVSGKSDDFEKELRSVIFSHADEEIRLGALEFDQLIEQQEGTIRDRLSQLRSDLHTLNESIVRVEVQMQPESKRVLNELILQQKRILKEHETNKPQVVEEPSGTLTPEQKKATDELAVLSESLERCQSQLKDSKAEIALLSSNRKSCANIREQLKILRGGVDKFERDTSSDVASLGLSLPDIFEIKINDELIVRLDGESSERINLLKELCEQLSEEMSGLKNQQTPLNSQLNGPQQVYQQFLDDTKVWDEKHVLIVGDSSQPNTLKGLEERLVQLNALPEALVVLKENRISISSGIYDVLDEQRAARERLFQPVQELIKSNSLIREGYRLQFKAELGFTADLIADQLFALVKQSSGEFRGDSESLLVVRRLVDECDFSQRESVVGLAEKLTEKLEGAAAGVVGIDSLLRKGKVASSVYDLLYGLLFIQPRYTLLFQDAHIEQLSPGQRGSLLLIFYLLVDKGNNPIILDQPEENLDNETIVSLLVPVLTEAKTLRQIIMVTHNPNLAVVCDAEQIIHCQFDRANDSSIIYSSGGIESEVIRQKVVDVLEGTMPAFNNRKIKYN